MKTDNLPEAHDPRTPEVLSFRATVVMTKHAGGKPTLLDVETALRQAGLRFAMPAELSGVIVISISDEQ